MTAVNRTFNVTQCCPLADLKASAGNVLRNVVTWSCCGVAQEAQLAPTLDGGVETGNVLVFKQ